MRIFKFYLILLIANNLFGQSKKIVIDNIDTLAVTNYDVINIKLDSILNTYESIGEYFILDRLVTDSLIQYNRKTIDVTIDTIIFKNDDDIRITVLNQIFRPLNKSTPKIQSTKIFNSIVKSHPFIMDNSEIYFGVNKKYNIGAVIDVKSNFNNYFSGLIGASRSNDKRWSVNGQMDIHIENQWRTTNLIDLHWKRLDEESQILNLRYEEPHPFSLPIGISMAYNQDLREGNYVNTKTALGIIKTIPGIGKLGFGGKNTKINSTAKGDSLGLTNLTTQSIYVEGALDYRNDYWLPTRGFFISLNSDIGNRSEKELNTVFVSGIFKVEKYFYLRDKNNFALKIFGNSNWINTGELHSGELVRYGGASNLRGYEEDFYKSNWVVIPSVDYNFQLSSVQQITLFSNIAVQDEYKPIPYGYGLGFTQVTKNSVLKLFYGLGRGDYLKSGKIHLQFLTRL